MTLEVIMKKYLELNTCYDCKYHYRDQSEKDWCNCLGREITMIKGIRFDNNCPLPTVTQQQPKPKKDN